MIKSKVVKISAVLFLAAFCGFEILYDDGIVGMTKKPNHIFVNPGCICHDQNSNVLVWISGPESLAAGERALYKVSVKKDTNIAAGFNVASFFGDLGIADSAETQMLRPNDSPTDSLELTHILPKLANGQDTISWSFFYRAPLTAGIVDTLYANGNSVDTSQDPSGDGWNFADNFLIHVTESPKFLTLPVDSIIAKDVNGKLLKAVKRPRPGKPVTKPNWANLMEETVVQGGFQPLATESDSAGGILIGKSYMQKTNPADPLKPKWKPIKDSANLYAWVRLTTWDFKNNKGKSANALPKTLQNKTYVHADSARGLDSTGSPGDAKRKKLKKQLTKLDPKKTSNKLFAELVALKFNIAASQLLKTPPGFGELIFDMDGNPLDELPLVEIAENVDSAMTYWQGHSHVFYDSLYEALHRINMAFVGPCDTVLFVQGGQLELKGAASLLSISFLKEGVTPPKVMRPTTTDTQTEEDFEDEEWDAQVDETPVAAKLYQNYPNPFNPTTSISFRLLDPSAVTLKVYNVLGQEVATLLNREEMDEGYQTVQFGSEGLASGVYFYRIDVQSDGELARVIETHKMLLIK